MAKVNNLSDFLADIADAIRAKKGINGVISAQNFSREIATIQTDGGGSNGTTPSTPIWTGHADAEGLRAIGWTDEDIAYYQENGVNWNTEDDEYHKVTDDNKALYGVLTVDNIGSYRDRIVYLPKIDTSGITSMKRKFYECRSLVAIPQLDTQNVTNMQEMFRNCYSLVSIPKLNTSKVMYMTSMFFECRSLVAIPQLDTQNVTNMQEMFRNCYSLVSIPKLNTSKVMYMDSMFYACYSLTSVPQLDMQNVTKMGYMFYCCFSLTSVPPLNTSKAYDISYAFSSCSSLVAISQLDARSASNLEYTFSACKSLAYANCINRYISISFYESPLLSKESLLYMIYNEEATSSIVITLHSYAYGKWATDPEVVAALEAHPNISISA